ncbi:MAG TPA: isoprenyl transferase [Nitrospinae bacterium]|nr:isoprenyl transferase [Nitrospinota bacterium]
MSIPALLKQVDINNLPKHIAIIMDGNGRWAKKRFLPRIAGHRAGVKTVDRIVTICRKIGIKALTLYSFSEENWSRPKNEINALMEILKRYLKKELDRMLKEDIRFNTIGTIDNLPLSAQKIIQDAKERTKNSKGMVLTLALSYGSRSEIVDAVREIASDIKKNKISVEDITLGLFQSYLYTKDLPEPDLLIRTSGELRISNFLLYQIAYAELYFTDLLWPDFKEDDLLKAVIEFQARERRFGMTGEQITKERQ